MYFISAAIAITGAVGYQFFIRQIPTSINPVVSIMGVYVAALILSAALLPFFPAEGGVQKHIQQLNWTQLAVAGSVFLLELGFLLMYRNGWNLSTANLVTGVFINIVLVAIGIAVLGEKLSPVNAIGIVLSIIGVAMISYRPG